MTQLETLIYVSTAAADLRAQDIASIIQRSEEMNLREGVCGMLLYCDKRFMQCIEGTVEGVQSTYRRIQMSSRHRDIVELFNASIDHRRFSSWDWAYRSDASQHFSSPLTRHFLSLRGGPGHGFIEQNILTGFWNDSRDSNQLWGDQ